MSDKNYERIRLICRIILLLFPLSEITIGVFDIDTSLFFYLSIPFCVLYFWLLFSNDPKYYVTEYKFELFFITACIISVLINLKYHNIYSFVRLAEVIMFISMLIFNKKKSNKKKLRNEMILLFKIIISILFINVCLSILFQLLYSFYDINLSFMQYFSRGMFGGIYGNGNQLAIYSFISMMLSFYLLSVEKKKIFFINILVSGALILFSGCRSVMLVMLFLILININFNFKKIKNYKYHNAILIIIALCIIICVSILIFITTKKINDYGKIKDIETFINSLTGNRLIMWEEAYSLFKHSPIVGVGLSNIQNAAKIYLGNSSLLITRNYENVHNLIVNILVYTGILGAISLLLLANKFIIICFKQVKKYRYLVLLCFGLVILDMFDIVLLFNHRLPIFIFCLIMGYFELINQEN